MCTERISCFLLSIYCFPFCLLLLRMQSGVCVFRRGLCEHAQRQARGRYHKQHTEKSDSRQLTSLHRQPHAICETSSRSGLEKKGGGGFSLWTHRLWLCVNSSEGTSRLPKYSLNLPGAHLSVLKPLLFKTEYKECNKKQPNLFCLPIISFFFPVLGKNTKFLCFYKVWQISTVWRVMWDSHFT